MNLNRLKTVLEICANFEATTYSMLEAAAYAKGVPKNSLIRHLRIAGRLGLIGMTRDGRHNIYTVTDLGLGVLKHLNDGREDDV